MAQFEARKTGLLFIILLGAGLRMVGLFSITLSADEALFATWAKLINTGQDPFLLATAVDKPPFLFYGQAVFLGVLNSAEIAPLLPGLISSILLIPLTYKLTIKRFSDPLTALIAALFVATSPLLIRYGTTALTDIPALMLFVVALVVLQFHYDATSGVLVALSLATRFPILLMSPLVLLFCSDKFQWKRFATASIVLLSGLFCWLVMTQGGEWGRSGDARLLRGLRLISSWEVIPRLNLWGDVLKSAFGVNILIVTMILVLVLWWKGGADDYYLLAYTCSFFAFHFLVATALYDRYMIPLVWLLIILAARAAGLLVVGEFGRKILPLLLLIFMSIVGYRSTLQRVAVQADLGTAALGDYFADYPYGTVLYDHWYSWQSRYYLFEDRVHVAWIAHPDSLVENLTVFYDDNRYIVLPDDDRANRYHSRLREAGYHLEKRLQSGELSVYKIGR